MAHHLRKYILSRHPFAVRRQRPLAKARYSNGIDSFLNVLDAERQLLELQDQLAQSKTETGLALVALYKALGGGWENAVVVESQNSE